MATLTTPASPSEFSQPTRRDILFVATAVFAGAGAAATMWPLIDQMNPDAATIAAGGPIDIDISALAPGQQMVALWREHPVFVVHRTPEALKSLQDPALLAHLRDPDSHVLQQPAYAANWHRSLRPDFLVLVGVCTHLGCIPFYKPTPNSLDNTPNWPGGYFCPCHGSKYDLAGRVFEGVPAPYNLPAPPYNFVSDKILRIGENPPGQNFNFESIVQL